MRIAILAAFPLHELSHFGEDYRPTGHYATWLPQLARSFEKFPDLEIHWVIMSDLVQSPMGTVEFGQKFYVLPTGTSGRATSLFREDRSKIQNLLHQIQPDLVHGWGTEDVYGLAAVLSGFPNIVSMQGILSYYAMKNRMPARGYLQSLLELFILWKADLITTESHWGRRVLKRRNPFAKVAVVEYGVQPLFFDVPWTPNASKPRAVFIGTMTPRKGIQDLVEAFRVPSLASFELQVVGGVDGAWAENLRMHAPTNIHWLGRKSVRETAEILSSAWCLALPTRADTSPNVVKEARVIGLPVITSPHGGQSDYIQDGINGFLVENGDVSRLADCLLKIFASLDLTKKLGLGDHVAAREHFRPERTAQLFKQIYSRFLSRSVKS